MTIPRRALLALTCAAAALLPVAAVAQTTDWPTKPITMVVPYPPGGVNDLVARAVADRMSQSLGKPVIIANRAGAATTVASNFAAKAAPDGYTIYAAGTSLVINPTLQGNVQYDTKRDFRPVSLMSVTPFILHVHPALPVADLAGLVAHARANPDKLNIASSGIGATNHMAAELLKEAAQIRLVHVPYKGGAQAGQDVAAGNAQMMFSAAIEAMPLLDGKLTRDCDLQQQALARLPRPADHRGSRRPQGLQRDLLAGDGGAGGDAAADRRPHLCRHPQGGGGPRVAEAVRPPGRRAARLDARGTPAALRPRGEDLGHAHPREGHQGRVTAGSLQT